MDYRPEGRSGTRTVAVAEQIVSRLEKLPRSGWQTRVRLVVALLRCSTVWTPSPSPIYYLS